MGSLMAGWDSPTKDPKKAILSRNHSLTKEEINAYWKLKKENEEEHLRAISNLSDSLQLSRIEEAEKKLQKSNSMPVSRMNESLDDRKNGWWTKSNWAFLNEPPTVEAASSKYASQFHVASMAAPKLNQEQGIST